VLVIFRYLPWRIFAIIQMVKAVFFPLDIHIRKPDLGNTSNKNNWRDFKMKILLINSICSEMLTTNRIITICPKFSL